MYRLIAYRADTSTLGGKILLINNHKSIDKVYRSGLFSADFPLVACDVYHLKMIANRKRFRDYYKVYIDWKVGVNDIKITISLKSQGIWKNDVHGQGKIFGPNIWIIIWIGCKK